MVLTVGSLFSGIGGLDLGLERAGMEVRWQCEVDDYCSRVLAEHWPGVPNLGDVTKVDWAEVERVDVICGGYPCQPFSLAGARRGTDDERHLWPHFRDALSVLRPRYALLENVPGHLSLGFDRVLADLAELGFDAEWDCVPAAAVGAPHLRYRLFVIAYAVSDELRLESVAECGCGGASESRDDGAQWLVADADGRGQQERAELDREPQLGTTDRNPCRRHADGLRNEVADPDRALGSAAGSTGETVFGPATLERLRRCRRRLGSQWATEPDVGRVAHGVPARVDRLRGLGNAVVPQVAQFIGEQLLVAVGLSVPETGNAEMNVAQKSLMIVQMPAGVQNERLTNTRLADANEDGRVAVALAEHNGLLVFVLDRASHDVRQQVVTFPPDEQFEQPMNERLAALQADGWKFVAMQSHNGFLVVLVERAGS